MLSDTKLRNLKPDVKRYKVCDSDGLYIEVMTSGKKYWRFRYTESGKRRWFTLGEYPVVGLKEARELRDQAKRDLFNGDPLDGTQEEVHAEPTFGEIANNWFTQIEQRLTSEKEKQTARGRLTNHVIPFIGDKPINSIQPADILAIIKRLESRGTLEIAHRVHQTCSRIFRYAVISGICDRDPAADIRDAIMPVPKKHFASITDAAGVGELLRSIDIYPGLIVRCALKFSALTFCRPGEIRHAEWAEIDFVKCEWRIPAEKMKKRRHHIVPLSSQALAVLEDIKPATAHGRYVFPNARSPKGDRPMSETAVLVALRSMGYTKEQMTAHGFRSMASTLLNENGFPPDHIERQLAHVEGNSVRAAYNYAEHLPERRKMMQWWGDYLDRLRLG